MRQSLVVRADAVHRERGGKSGEWGVLLCPRMDIASSEPHQRLCSRMVSDTKQLLNNGTSLEGWRRMNAGGEF